jgi:hypothetical protein
MGEIIIKVPGDIKEVFEIKNELKLQKLFDFLKKEEIENKKAIIESVVGLWSGRYKNKNPAEIGKAIREESWRK